MGPPSKLQLEKTYSTSYGVSQGPASISFGRRRNRVSVSLFGLCGTAGPMDAPTAPY
ncbi:hypothetical protein Ancab_033599, partial [Ancistrocladus abbreviatus]